MKQARIKHPWQKFHFTSPKTNSFCTLAFKTRKWAFYSIAPPVDPNEHKVFLMGSLDEVKLAEDICDTDFHRHCTGIAFFSKSLHGHSVMI